MLRIRPAISSDKEQILSFCTSTFSWGDYIEQVWDIWYANRSSGQLLVAEYYSNNDDTNANGSGGSSNKGAGERRSIAISHVALCPDKRSIWLEGVRVHPDYRRSKVATALIESMLQYGREHGASEACAVVATDNNASQHMMERNGFDVISKWAYYGTKEREGGGKEVNPHHHHHNHCYHSNARPATAKDLDDIWQYLGASEIYRLSAKRYVKEWQWYPLDRKVLANLIKDQCVVVTGNNKNNNARGKKIDGIAVLNPTGYWNKKNILQIVYLDSASKDSLDDLISFAANLYTENNFDRLHILCHQSIALDTSKDNNNDSTKLKIDESEQFLLYNKKIFKVS